MIKILKANNKNYLLNINRFLNYRRSRNRFNNSIVKKILYDVKKNKQKALIKYERKFSNNSKINVNSAEINQSIKKLSPKIKSSIDFAYKRIFDFHKKQKIKNIRYFDKYRNLIQYKNVPLNSVGIYVPANLPSSLLMNAIPAKIAKVKRVVLANPRVNGKLNPAVMYAARKLGIKEILSIGGAQAIASLCYIQNVDKIIGPGNNFVSQAKLSLFGDVGTESMIAGPSEICVIADKNTNINEISTSLVGQAEHDENSQCILITKDKLLIKKVINRINILLKRIPRKLIALKSLRRNGLIIYVSKDSKIPKIVNLISPEHLEINVIRPNKYLKKIFNVGSICVGKYSAMAASDYTVGINHVLPTSGSAKFSSGLNVGEFYKKISQIKLSKKGIEVIGKKAINLAEYENLHGHVESIKSRMEK